MTELDASGNGNDGTYLVGPTFVPGLIVGDTAWTPLSSNTVTLPGQPIGWTNAWSYEGWVEKATGGSGSESLFFASSLPGAADGAFLWIRVNSEILRVADGLGTVWQSPASTVPYDGARHHVVVTFDGSATVLLYVDGSLVSWAITGTSSPSWIAPAQNVLCGNTGFGGTYDEFAAYTTVLSSTQVSAHYAATSSFAAYSAAVLADSPDTYYHFTATRAGWHVGRIGVG